MPRVSGRATVRLVRHLGIIFIPGFSRHGHKGSQTQSSVRSHIKKKRVLVVVGFFLDFVFVFVFVFYLSFISQQSGQ